MLDTHVYEVEFQYVITNKYAVNLIAENLYSQTDPDGNEFMLLKDIIDHRSTNKAVPLSDDYEGDPNTHKYKKNTTSWELMAE